MSDPNEVITDQRLEKRTRCRFSVTEKKRLLAEADDLPLGERGAWLGRGASCSGVCTIWRSGGSGLDSVRGVFVVDVQDAFKQWSTQ